MRVKHRKVNMMKFLLVFVLMLTLPLSVLASDYQGSCSISFKGSSTLHDFNGKASCLPFSASNSNGVLDIPDVRVAIAGMDTDNASRDKKMREMFEDKKFPLITGKIGKLSLNDIRAISKSSPDTPQKITFLLEIRDIAKPLTASVKNITETDTGFTADIEFNVSLAEYKLYPPSVLGMIKVSDKVAVTVAFVMKDSKVPLKK